MIVRNGILDGPAKSQEVSVESRGAWGTLFAAAKKLSSLPAGCPVLKENPWSATFCETGQIMMASQKVAFPMLFVNVGHERGGWGSLLRLLRKRV
ncbi:MAG: hypothetical protein AB1547_06375 [Thermodesulfobacteriota bacterium]